MDSQAEQMRATMKCPWTDWEGNEIWEGDIITHPHSQETGKVVFLSAELLNHGDRWNGDKWKVDYGDGVLSSLILQIGEKGRAVVIKSPP